MITEQIARLQNKMYSRNTHKNIQLDGWFPLLVFMFSIAVVGSEIDQDGFSRSLEGSELTEEASGLSQMRRGASEGGEVFKDKGSGEKGDGGEGNGATAVCCWLFDLENEERGVRKVQERNDLGLVGEEVGTGSQRRFHSVGGEIEWIGGTVVDQMDIEVLQ